MPARSSNPARGDRWLAALFALLVLCLYARTAAPDVVAEGDCGEYVAAARVAGIPHAPGAPTYMCLAAVLGQFVPAEALARTLNLLSAFFGALTVGGLLLGVLGLVRRAWPESPVHAARAAAVAAGVTLASTTEFWNQALSAEVYTLSTALLVGCLGLLARPTPRRLGLAALLAGLAFGVHYNVGVPCALLVCLRAWRERSGRAWAVSLAGAFVLGLSTFAYLPLRSLADPALDFGDPETPGRFLRMLTLADMPTGKRVGRELGVLWEQLGAVAGLARKQLPGWILVLAGVGGLVALRRQACRAALAALAFVFVLDYAGILVNANFALVPEEIYELRFLFLPAYCVLAVLVGLSVAAATAALERRAPRGAWTACVLLCAAAAPWCVRQARLLDKHDVRLWSEYGEALLAVPEGPALLFTFGDNAWMPAFYLQTVHGKRPDVTLIAAGLLRHPWYRAQLRARFPELVLEEQAPGVPGIARANLARVPSYHADPRPQGLQGFQEVPSGLCMRILPEAERVLPLIPPAPVFTAPHAPLDLRERSVRADALQAYVRTARWCRAAGFAREAELAFETGLELVPPEPAMEEFQLVRAGLWLERGDLQAALGRPSDALASWRRAQEEAPGSPPALAAEQRAAARSTGTPP